MTARWSARNSAGGRAGGTSNFSTATPSNAPASSSSSPIPLAPIPLDVYVNLSKLSSGLIFDHRNDVLDASRGLVPFVERRVCEHAPRLRPALRPLSFPPVLLQESRHQRVVLASAARLGLADGFDQELIVSERFFAGGANSVRGYRNDSLGPQLNGIPVGGEGMLIFNQEFRFPIYKWFRGVAFVDAGNVYADPSSIDLRPRCRRRRRPASRHTCRTDTPRPRLPDVAARAPRPHAGISRLGRRFRGRAVPGAWFLVLRYQCRCRGAWSSAGCLVQCRGPAARSMSSTPAGPGRPTKHHAPAPVPGTKHQAPSTNENVPGPLTRMSAPMDEHRPRSSVRRSFSSL